MKAGKSQNMLYNPHLWRRITVGLLHFLCMTVPFFFLFTTDELFEFNKMMLTYGTTLLILASYSIYVLLRKPFTLPKTPLDIPIFIFVISQVLSTIFSIHPLTSIFGYYSRFHGGLLSTLTYVAIFYAAVGTLKPREIKNIFITFLVSGTFVGIYGAYEHFGHSISCLLVTKGASFGVDCWVQDVQNRVFATFGQPNWLAAYLIALIPISTIFIITEKKWYLKILAVVTTVFFLLVLVFTQSRSGILGFLVGLCICVAFLCIQFFRKRTDKTVLIPALLLGLATSAILIWYPTPISQFVTQRMAPTNQSVQQHTAPTDIAPVNRLDIGGTDSGDIRKIVWTGAYRVWQRYPLFGSGVETFAYSYYKDRPIEHNLVSEWDFLYNKSHNEFLNFLATTGIVGLLSYCLFLGSCVWIYVRIMFSPPKESLHEASWYGLALLAATAALTVSNFFGFSTVMVGIVLFIFPAFAVVLTPSYSQVETASAPSGQRNETVIISGMTIVALATLFGLSVLFRYWSADIQYTQGKTDLANGKAREGFALLEQAVANNPQEALFVDTLAGEYANYAIEFARVGQATAAAQLASQSLANIRKTLELNPRQLNFYKTSARSLILLSQFDDQYLTAAKEVLTTARELAPTDPKVVYNLGLIEINQGHQKEGIALLEETIRLKPNYDTARVQLADEYEKMGNYDQAIDQLTYIVKYISPNATDIQAKIASLSAQRTKKK